MNGRLALVLPALLISSWTFAGTADAADGTGGASLRALRPHCCCSGAAKGGSAGAGVGAAANSAALDGCCGGLKKSTRRDCCCSRGLRCTKKVHVIA